MIDFDLTKKISDLLEIGYHYYVSIGEPARTGGCTDTELFWVVFLFVLEFIGTSMSLTLILL